MHAIDVRDRQIHHGVVPDHTGVIPEQMRVIQYHMGVI